MSDMDDFVRMIQRIAAGGPAAGDRAASNDPYVRMLEQARRTSVAGDLVSIEDLAAERGVSVRTVRRWNNRTDAPQRVKRGRRHMYRRADVKRWLEQGTFSAKHAPADGESL